MQNTTAPRKKDASYGKILTVFIAGFLAIILLALLERYMLWGDTFLAALTALRWFIGLCALLFLAGLALLAAHGRGGAPAGRGATLGKALLLLAPFFGLPLMLIFVYDFVFAIKMLYVVYPALCLIYLIHLVYQREFFLHVVVCSLSAALMWMMSIVLAAGNATHRAVMLSAALVLLTAAAAGIFMLSKTKGKAQLFGRRFKVLDQNAAYSRLWGTCALMALLFVAAFFLGASVAYYLVFAILGYLLLLTIFFTAKLI